MVLLHVHVFVSVMIRQALWVSHSLFIFPCFRFYFGNHCLILFQIPPSCEMACSALMRFTCDSLSSHCLSSEVLVFPLFVGSLSVSAPWSCVCSFWIYFFLLPQFCMFESTYFIKASF